MKLVLALLNAALFLAAANGQATDCPADLVTTDDCIAVVNPIACYNEYRWTKQTLQCIEGTDDTQRKQRACKCAGCIGTVMVNWAKTQKLC